MSKRVMFPEEEHWKEIIYLMLQNDGKGHRHAVFAEYIKDFDLYIVNAKDEPRFTASMDSENGIIRVSSGFLTDSVEDVLQISVLLRHELAHHLLSHMIKDKNYLRAKFKAELEQDKEFLAQGKDVDTELDEIMESFLVSKSWHDLANVLADLEVADLTYSLEDEHTVKNMTLNGELIGGLLMSTERPDWHSKTLEEMYVELEKELAEMHKKILDNWKRNETHEIEQTRVDKFGFIEPDQIKIHAHMNFYAYLNPSKESNFTGSLSDFLNNNGAYHMRSKDTNGSYALFPFRAFMNEPACKPWVKIINWINDEFTNTSISKADFLNIIDKISQSGFIERFKLTSPNGKTIMLNTAEEKEIAEDALLAKMAEENQYETWYEKVVNGLNNNSYSNDDIAKILKGLEDGTK